MKEIWKDIKNYEGIYQVSNMGQIKSLKREYKTIGRNQSSEYETIFKIKEKILKQASDKDGYKIVCLRNKGKKENKKVHRLVAEAFIPNPNNYPQINHIDENKSNNILSNLEYCTCQYNIVYSKGRKVKQYDLNYNFVREWNSITEASKFIKQSSTSIHNCCIGKTKKAGNYIWEYL